MCWSGVGVGGGEEQAGGAHSGGWWGRRRERGGGQRQRGGDRRSGGRHHGGGGCGRPPPRRWRAAPSRASARQRGRRARRPHRRRGGVDRPPSAGGRATARRRPHRRRGCTARHGANKKKRHAVAPRGARTVRRWHRVAGLCRHGVTPWEAAQGRGGGAPRGPASRPAASPCHGRRRGPSPPAVAAAAGGHGGGEGDGRPVIRRHPHLSTPMRVGYVTTAGMGRRRHVDDEGAPLPCGGAWQAALAAARRC